MELSSDLSNKLGGLSFARFDVNVCFFSVDDRTLSAVVSGS